MCFSIQSVDDYDFEFDSDSASNQIQNTSSFSLSPTFGMSGNPMHEQVIGGKRAINELYANVWEQNLYFVEICFIGNIRFEEHNAHHGTVVYVQSLWPFLKGFGALE